MAGWLVGWVWDIGFDNVVYPGSRIFESPMGSNGPVYTLPYGHTFGYMHIYWQTDRQTDRPTNIHTYLQADIQTDRQTFFFQNDAVGTSPRAMFIEIWCRWSALSDCKVLNNALIVSVHPGKMTLKSQEGWSLQSHLRAQRAIPRTRGRN